MKTLLDMGQTWARTLCLDLWGQYSELLEHEFLSGLYVFNLINSHSISSWCCQQENSTTLFTTSESTVSKGHLKEQGICIWIFFWNIRFYYYGDIKESSPSQTKNSWVIYSIFNFRSDIFKPSEIWKKKAIRIVLQLQRVLVRTKPSRAKSNKAF